MQNNKKKSLKIFTDTSSLKALANTNASENNKFHLNALSLFTKGNNFLLYVCAFSVLWSACVTFMDAYF